MNKSILGAAVIAVALSACGRIDNEINSLKSAAGMLKRTVTLYDANGGTIKTWTTTNQIEYSGAMAAFVDDKGTNVRVAGTFVIEGR